MSGTETDEHCECQDLLDSFERLGYPRLPCMCNLPAPFSPKTTPVLIMYGIEQNKINCDILFNLFCTYGNCMKIMFMKSKPDTVMVQMATDRQALEAKRSLDGAVLRGCRLKIRPSNHEEIHDVLNPFKLPDNSPSFKDFTMSDHHRFTTREMADKNSMVNPSNGLHWRGAPITIMEETVIQMFVNHGLSMPTKVTVSSDKYAPGSLVVCQFDDTKQATEALIKCNNTQVYLRNVQRTCVAKLAFGSGTDGLQFLLNVDMKKIEKRKSSLVRTGSTAHKQTL